MRRAYLWLLLAGWTACGGDPTSSNGDAPPASDAPVVDAAVDAAVDAPDPCANAVCECTVATQDADCGPREVCDETGPGRACGCAPAYERVGADCVFAGAPSDPGFQLTGVWTPVGNGLLVDTLDEGQHDRGAGTLDRTGLCEMSRFTQSFVMPPRTKADSFKLVVTGRVANGTTSYISVGVNGEFHDARVVNNTYTTSSFCLGPRAYGDGAGSPVEIIVGAFGSCLAQTSSFRLRVDRVALQVAAPGECPEPDTVVNGDFEAGSAGWTFAASAGGTAAVVAGIGDNASSALQITSTTICSTATATGTIAFPAIASNARQAIELSYTATAGARLVVRLDGNDAATLAGTGTQQTQRVCVPAWAAGVTTSLGFAMDRSAATGCTARAHTFTLDSIRIVDDAACDASAPLVDPGFERGAVAAGPALGWGLSSGGPASATVTTAAGLPRSGDAALHLTMATECAYVIASTTIIAPAVQGAAGPAVKFFARRTLANPRASLFTVVSQPGAEAPYQELHAASTSEAYTEQRVCLAPGLAGRRIRLDFWLYRSESSLCASSTPNEEALVDDVTITTDPACPVVP